MTGITRKRVVAARGATKKSAPAAQKEPAAKGASPPPAKPARQRGGRGAAAAPRTTEVRILIVDDELESRRAYYTRFFALLARAQRERYKIVPIWGESPSDVIGRIHGREADLIVLDMMLRKGVWQDKGDAICKAIKSVDAALVLLSEDFMSDLAIRQIHKVFSDLRGTPILGFIPFGPWIKEHCTEGSQRLPDTQEEVWSFAFHEALHPGRDHRWKPTEENAITFLHLTDTHFGKTDADFMRAHALFAGAESAELVADMLLWTGDITNRAAPSEFALAAKFVDELRRANVLAGTAPICIVPGNHDLNWPLALASRLVRKNGPTHGDPWRWELGHKVMDPDLWRFGFRPYEDFLDKLIGAQGRARSAHGFRWLDQWAHRGFAVLELPIESHVVQSDSDHADPIPFMSDQEFDHISDAALQAILASDLAREVCILLLVHGRDPNVDPGKNRRWTNLRERLHEEGFATVIVAGHEHETQTAVQRRELTLVGVPHDPAAGSAALTLPGVSFITLSGLMTDTLSCSVTKLECRSDSTSRAVTWTPRPPMRWELSDRDDKKYESAWVKLR